MAGELAEIAKVMLGFPLQRVKSIREVALLSR